MYIVQSIVNVPEEKAEEVIGLYQNRSRAVDHYPGFLSFQLLQTENHPGELTVHMTWENKSAYLAWVRSDEFKRVHDMEKNYPDQELANIVPTVRKYDVRAN